MCVVIKKGITLQNKNVRIKRIQNSMFSELAHSKVITNTTQNIGNHIFTTRVNNNQ